MKKLVIKKNTFLFLMLAMFSAAFVVEIYYAKSLYIGLLEAFQQDYFTGVMVTTGLCVPFVGMVVLFLQIVE